MSVNGTSIHVASEVSIKFVCLYILCLLPFSIDGLGANYLFATIPLFVLMSGKSLAKPNDEILVFICACLITFTLSSIYQVEWLDYFDRRFVSFVLFVSMFSLCFVRITERDIASFKVAVAISAIYFTLNALVTFISMGAAAQAFESKDIVGSQRYGFIYILAFWIVWYERVLITSKTVKLIVLLLIILGLSLTFARASIVSFIASIFFCNLHFLLTKRCSLRKVIKRVAIGIGFGLISICLTYIIAPVIFDFMFVTLIDYTLSGSLENSLANPDGSEGARIFIWTNIFDFVVRNPLTGSGFLGVWALNLFGEPAGSAHNQYFDALLRLGFILFFAYIYFILKMVKFFYKHDLGLWAGLCGVLVYGLFHETFKESHGMFIFAMLLAISGQRRLAEN